MKTSSFTWKFKQHEHNIFFASCIILQESWQKPWNGSLLYCLKDIAVYEDSENILALSKIIKGIGEPRNYGLTDEEKEALERQAAEELLVKEAEEKAEQKCKEDKEREERMARWEEWVGYDIYLGKHYYLCVLDDFK